VWLAPCRSDSRLCALIVDAPTEVFTGGPGLPPPPPPPPPPAGRLLVTVSGAGLLTSGNRTIRCGWAPAAQTRCSEPIPPRPTVHNLRAEAHRPFRFARWGGVCRGAQTRCKARLRKRSYNGANLTFSVTGLFRRR
jgi:hypothetical protein